MVKAMAAKSVRVPRDSINKLEGRTVEIVVGDEQKIYSAHEGLIRSSSPFFDKALAGEWKESLQRTVQLPADEPKIFALYVHWLYYDTLPVFCNEPGLVGNSEYLDLVKAYVLGDKILDSRFQDTIIDAIVEKTRAKARDGASWYPVGEVLEHAYQNIAESAPILDLFVDLYVNQGQSSWLHDWADPTTIPQPFLLKLASKLLTQHGSTGKPVDAFNYRSHGKNESKSPFADGET